MAQTFNAMGLSTESKKFIASVFTFFISQPNQETRYSKFREEFDLPKHRSYNAIANDVTIKIMIIMNVIKIDSIEDDSTDAMIYVVPTQISEIDRALHDILNDSGLSDDQIRVLFGEPVLSDKKMVSNILNRNNGFHWYEISVGYPEVDTPVVIRIVDPTKVMGENREEYIPNEDIKIATWNGDTWKILPPFPKYDKSLCSQHENINDGCFVTHWADVTEDEISNWSHRFDYITPFKHLKIEVDKKHHEDVYMALMYGAAALAKAIGNMTKIDPHTGIRKYYEILCDLQACMDKEESITEED